MTPPKKIKMEDDLKKEKKRKEKKKVRRPKKNGRWPKKNGRRTNQPKST